MLKLIFVFTARSIVLCLVERGGIFGDMELVTGMRTNMMSVMSVSPTHTFSVSATNVERLIAKKNPHTMTFLRNGVVTKLINRSSSVQGVHVPLMRHLLFKLTEEEKPKPQRQPPLKLTKSLPDSDVLFRHLLESFKENRAELLEPLLPGTVYYKRLMHEKLRLRQNQRRRENERANDNAQSAAPWSRGAGEGGSGNVVRSNSVSSIQTMFNRIADENMARKAMMEAIIERRTKRLQEQEQEVARRRADEESAGLADATSVEETPRGTEGSVDGSAAVALGQDEYIRLIERTERSLTDVGLQGRGRDEDKDVFMTEVDRAGAKPVSAPADSKDLMNGHLQGSNSTRQPDVKEDAQGNKSVNADVKRSSALQNGWVGPSITSPRHSDKPSNGSPRQKVVFNQSENGNGRQIKLRRTKSTSVRRERQTERALPHISSTPVDRDGSTPVSNNTGTESPNRSNQKRSSAGQSSDHRTHRSRNSDDVCLSAGSRSTRKSSCSENISPRKTSAGDSSPRKTSSGKRSARKPVSADRVVSVRRTNKPSALKLGDVSGDRGFVLLPTIEKKVTYISLGYSFISYYF